MKQPTVVPREPTTVARIAGVLSKAVQAFGGFELTPETILSHVDRMSGLEDLHPEEIEEPLRLLCEDIAEFPPSDVGRLAINTELSRAFSARRRAQRLDPRLERPSRPPIIIAGWYRTGTTFLQNLLNGLPGYGYIPTYRLIEPHANRLAPIKVEAGMRLMQALTPEMRVLHPVDYRGPEECWLTLAQHLIVDGYAFHWKVPRYSAWLQRVDRQAAYYNWARNLAQFETVVNHGLILKDPSHQMSLSKIIEAVPDARIIWTHRDPAEAIGSFGSLTAVQRRQIYGEFDPHDAGKRCMQRFRQYLDAGMAQREFVPEGQLVDIPHKALREDAPGVVEQICEFLDLPFDGDAIRAQQARIREGRRGRVKHRYELSQWGLTEEEIRDEFSDYVIPKEVGLYPYGYEPPLRRSG